MADNEENAVPKMPRPEFTGDPTINDPTFQPQPDQSHIPLIQDHMTALQGLQALQHPQDNGQNIGTLTQFNDGAQTDPNAPTKMTDDELLSFIKMKVESSHQWYGSGKLTTKRIQADQYYRGEPLGNELDGRSQVVSRDVAEAVDGAMPSVMRVFAGTDNVVVFEPHGPEDEDAAAQATDYINHVFMNENEGFMILYTWFKDAFLKKNGIIKVWHDVRLERVKNSYEGLTQQELQTLQADPYNQVSNIQQYQDVVISTDQMGNTQQQPIQTFSCVVSCAKPEKRIMVDNVAPDEFIIERRAVSLNKTGFVAHRGKRTISDLLECGYDRNIVMSIPRADDNDFSQERIERFNDEDQLPAGTEEPDPTMRKVWVTEAYIKCDYDGDGIAEWRQVIIASEVMNKQLILSNIEVDDHPFADLTPDPEPHKFYGQSFFDKTKDIQDIKTALVRGILDNIYQSNVPRHGIVEGQVNMDDMLDARPGGIVRMKRPDSIVPIEITPIGEQAMQVVEYIDNVRERRTGTAPGSAGVNPDILNSTATGADIANNQNQAQLELLCRIFAETGLKRLFRLLFKLVCEHQNVARTVRLRNKWVNVNPADWKDRMDVTANVGLGMGSKTQQAMNVMSMLKIDETIVQMQGGLTGPLVNAQNIYEKLKKLVEAVGWKGVERYYSDPKGFVPPPPPPPSPEQQVKMQQLQTESVKAQAEADKARVNALGDMQNKRIDFGMKQLDRDMKLIQLAALQIETGKKQAEQADNYRQQTDIPAPSSPSGGG